MVTCDGALYIYMTFRTNLKTKLVTLINHDLAISIDTLAGFIAKSLKYRLHFVSAAEGGSMSAFSSDGVPILRSNYAHNITQPK